MQALGADWASFARYFRECRRLGDYVSRDEIEPDVTGIAAPIFNGDGLVIGSLTLVFESHRSAVFDVQLMGKVVAAYAREVTGRVGATMVAALLKTDAETLNPLLKKPSSSAPSWTPIPGAACILVALSAIEP